MEANIFKLPDTYAGRYLQYGCSGFCVVVYHPALPSCRPSQLGGDFAWGRPPTTGTRACSPDSGRSSTPVSLPTTRLPATTSLPHSPCARGGVQSESSRVITGRYTGSGSIDDAANFVPESPHTPPHTVIRWADDYPYDLPGPAAP
jgi:hypothetical protein